MNENLNLGLVSHSSSVLNRLESLFQIEVGIMITRLLLNEDDYYPQASDIDGCDVLVMVLDDTWESMLERVAANQSSMQPGIVFTGPADNAEMIRLAFKSGGVDYIGEPWDKAALIQAVRAAVDSKKAVVDDSESDLTLFVTPKGGAGSTTLAVNLAHLLSIRADNPNVLIMDLDIQYGNLPLNYNEKPNARLASALQQGELIDSDVLAACISRTDKNPQVLATYSDQLISPWDLDPQQVASLFSLVTQKYDHVIVDLPRSIDPLTFHALERARRICVIVQQSLADMRNANQYMRLLQDQGISAESICLIINRHEKRNTIRTQDFMSAFVGHEVFNVPNDYKRVSYASDNTMALVERWRNAVITKSLVELSEHIWPTGEEPGRWPFGGLGKSRKAA